MDQFLPFFIILISGILFSAVFRRFHLPWAIALVTAGIILGPHGFKVIELNSTLEFMGQLGLIFLMFMAGLETKLSKFKEHKKDIIELSVINSLIPLFVGLFIGLIFGFSNISALLLGIIFISSSIAVVIPTLESNGLLHTKLGGSIVAATILEDVTSLILLSILLQVVNPTTILPLPLFYLLLFSSLFLMRWLLPKARSLLSPSKHGRKSIFQQDFRIILAILVGTVVIFELLGLHPIIAGFFAGLVLSDSIESKALTNKLHTISYGIFIPVFFVVIGANTDMSVFKDLSSGVLLIGVVVIGSVLAKFISGWAGGKLIGFNGRENVIIGAATVPQLSTTLAAVFAAVELGLLKEELVTAMVILSLVTTFISPFVIKMMRGGSKVKLKSERKMELSNSVS